MPKKILLIHQNFPGQFRALAAELASRSEFEVRAIGRDSAPGLAAKYNIPLHHYKPHRDVARQTHPYLRRMEDAVLHGQAALRLMLQLSAEGYRPDLILAHPGWGETLFAKEAFPDAKLIHFCEYYYHSEGADANFDPEFPSSIDDQARIRARNALHLLNLENCDLGVTPTRWQHSLHPSAYQNKIRIIHEGIAIDELRPNSQAMFSLPDGRKLKAGDPVVTYVARNLEPYRGFHIFMRALPEVLRRHRECQVLIVGGNEVSYGAAPKQGAHWKEVLLNEIRLPAEQCNRLHFLGRLSYEKYKSLLQVSAAHVYLTYPFVLSWSMLEAMATGCLLIASRTSPVEEVIKDGDNGVLNDFFDTQALAEKVLDALNCPGKYAEMRERARRFVQGHYDAKSGVCAYLELL